MHRLLSVLRHRLRSVFRRSKVEAELDEELQYHLDREIEYLMEVRGVPQDEARYTALRSITRLAQNMEECRDMRQVNWFENITHDVRFAFRQMHKESGFTAAAVSMLGLGLAVSLAIFAFVDAALLKPLPYKAPDRLIGVYEKVEPQCIYCNLSIPDYRDYKRMNSTLESLDAYQGGGFTLTTATGGAESVDGARVTDGFFRTLGVRPVQGRDFHSGEDQSGSARTVVLSYAGWQKRFGGDAGAIGRTVTLNRIAFEVIGVLPREFHFAPVGRPEFFVAMQPESECDNRRSCHGIYGVGRLKSGVSLEAARDNLVAIAAELEKQYPDMNRNQGANARMLGEVINGSVRPVLVLLMSGAALLLLISVVDVIGLLIVRSENRRKETAVRSALGASAARLAGQFIVEACSLVALSAALGLAGAHVLMKGLLSLLSEDVLNGLPFLVGLGWNWRSLAVAAAISTLCVVAFSIAPNLRQWATVGVRTGLSDAGARGSSGTVWRKVGAKLVVVEVATAVLMLAGAGLLGRSFQNLIHVKLGFEPERLVSSEIIAPKTYKDRTKTIALADNLLEQVSHLPGVTAAAIIDNGGPVRHNGNTSWIRILGRPWNGDHIDMPYRPVSPEYFTTIGARLAQGRFFTNADDAGKPAVVIVNQALVRAYFPNEQPLGKQLSHVSTKPDPMEIVGVVEDIRQGGLDVDIPPIVYTAFRQDPGNGYSLVLRTGQDQSSTLAAVQALVRRIDPEIITRDNVTIRDRIYQSNAAYMRRTSTWLVTGFALAALVLSLVGLYGVIAYSVSQRTREFGVRMALGAEARVVYRMVLEEAAWLVAIGLVAGLACATGMFSLFRSLLFGVSPWDPPTLALIACVLGMAALIAALVPARRAASVDPAEVLRLE